MLHTTTWGDFFSFILPALIIYYIVVLLKYYRRELDAFFFGVTDKSRAEAAAVARAMRVMQEDSQQPTVQPELFDGRDKGLAGLETVDHGGQSPELFKVMATVVAILKDVVTQGVAEKITKEQLLTQITDILTRYGQLKDTPYQASINSFLTRTCASNFSLVLEQGELATLWG